jgi:hypothetical protein
MLTPSQFIRRPGLLLALLAILSGGARPMVGHAQTAPAAFQPVASGEFGDVNAKDGDAAFNADYFAAPDLTGAPVTSRLEGAVGSGGARILGITGGYSARWSATVTPNRSGEFPLSLRSIASAVLMVDGKILLQRADDATNFNQRTVGSVVMEASKPYEFVVEMRSPDGKGRIALEWARPQPLAAGAKTAVARSEQLAGPGRGELRAAVITLNNDSYSLASQPDGSFVLTQKGGSARATFAPEFAVVWQPPGAQSRMESKGGKYQDDKLGWMNYVVPSWDKETDYLVAAHPRTRLRASGVAISNGLIKWSFPPQPGYELSAEVSLPAGRGEPVIVAQLKSQTAAQFSIGYVGAPATGQKSADWIWQPLIWQDKRFPNRSYLTKEFQCPIPWAMTGVSGTAIGVGVDAKELPYRMPTTSDSRFGVLVRNAAGEMQPMVFAPVLGGPESKINAGEDYQFTFRICARKEAWYDTYKHLAQSLYQFNDVRENGECSLNTTIENMMDYVLTDRFSYWYPKFKTWGYQNDGGPGAGRQQSAADAIGLALVCDSSAFYQRRALPTLEYMLSRKTVSTRMDRPDFMGGPVNIPADLVAAYRLTGGRIPIIRRHFEQSADGASTGQPQKPAAPGAIGLARNRMLEDLTQYRLTGRTAFLDRARAAADRYIELRIDRPVEDFRDAASSFWNELSPAWDVLYELYEETGDAKYRTAAAQAMRQFTGYTYLVPVIPSGNFTAQPGGIYNGQPVPEETVPAWRVSPNGLAAECAGTAHSHRGVYMTPYASYLARLGFAAGDSFFTDIARNAVVGRYCNYPSYAYRNGFTTLHQKADYPLRPFEEIKKFTSAHYNHPLPMAAFLVDYLFSDVFARSAGRIDFPSDYTMTGAYFRNRVYGARPGRFYDESGMVPWLPKGLLQLDSVQVNYLAARGNGKLYLALANQSARPVTTAIVLNPDRYKLEGAVPARQWRDNQPAEPMTVTGGRVTVTLSPKGLTCLAIEGGKAITEIQEAMLDPRCEPLPDGSSRTVATGFEDVTATALRFGRGLTTVHVWLKAKPSQVRSAKLIYRESGSSREVACPEFPYEFTVPVADAVGEFHCEVEAVTANGNLLRSGPIILPLRNSIKQP